jgi:hypothetical protein
MTNKIPVSKLIEIVTSEKFYEDVCRNYDNKIQASIDISQAINSFSRSAIARPVFKPVISPDREFNNGVLNPKEQIIIEILNKYYVIPSTPDGYYRKSNDMSAIESQEREIINYKNYNLVFSENYYNIRNKIIEMYWNVRV